jgi:ABC-type sugar transport system substrate-binding protein
MAGDRQMNSLRALWISRVAATAGLLVAYAFGFAGEARGQGTDRMLGMAEPVKAAKPYRIAYAAVQMNEDFYLGIAWGVVDEANRAGAQLVRITSAGGYGHSAEQINQLEQLRALGVDAILIVGATYNGYDRVIERIVASGIRVISVASPIGAAKTTLGVMQDEANLGARIAGYICTKNPKATVLTLPGPAGTEWNKVRFDGFRARAAQCGLTLVGNTFRGNISIEDGQQQVLDGLLKNPGTPYVYAVSGALAVGAAQQIERSGSTAKVVTGTVNERTVALMNDGVIEMVASEPSVLFGRAALQYAIRSLNGDPLPNVKSGVLPYPVVFVPNTELTRANINSYDLYLADLPPKGWKPPMLAR